MYRSKIKLLFTTLFCFVVLLCVPLTGQAYYGGYLDSSLYGGLYGGLYGSSLYGGLYGGLYGSYIGGSYSPYYSWSYPYGLGRLSYASASEPVPVRSQAALTTLLGGGGGGLLNPTGSWSGTWLSYISLKGGICNMNLLYTPITGTVSGTAGLLLNKLIPIPINVSGVYSTNPFTLTGSFLDPTSLVTYYEELDCTLITATFMTGTYSIHDLLYTKTDIGEFNIDLVPVI